MPAAASAGGGGKKKKNPVSPPFTYGSTAAAPGPHPHAARKMKRQARKAPNRGVPKGTHVTKAGGVAANKGRKNK